MSPFAQTVARVSVVAQGSGCARHKVEKHRETGTMWRDALQIAGWDAHVVQSALIAAGISNYGCHTPVDAPWEKYGCICMDGLKLHFVMMHRSFS